MRFIFSKSNYIPFISYGKLMFLFIFITMVIKKVPFHIFKLHTNPFLNNTIVDANAQEMCCLLLINNGVNVNGTHDNTDPDSVSPLHFAIWYGYDRIGEFLIRAGANINTVRGRLACTPLHSVYMPLEVTLAGKRSLTRFSW